jgi:hypothetical protein
MMNAAATMQDGRNTASGRVRLDGLRNITAASVRLQKSSHRLTSGDHGMWR